MVLRSRRKMSNNITIMGELSVNNDTVTFDWHEITSYEKACEVLNIRPIKLNKASDRPLYVNIASAVQQLLTICEAINGNGKWYNEHGNSYYPILILYSKEEMQDLGEEEYRNKGIRPLLTAIEAHDTVYTGVRCLGACGSEEYIYVRYDVPLRLNSKEKANFIGEQFFELCCQCCGLTPLTE